MSRYLLLFSSLNELSTFFFFYILSTFVFPNRRIQTVARIGEHEKGIWTRKRVFWDKGREPRTTCPRVRSLIAIFWFQPSQETCSFCFRFQAPFWPEFFFFLLFIFVSTVWQSATYQLFWFFFSFWLFLFLRSCSDFSLSLSCFRLHNTKVATPTRRKKKESEKKKKRRTETKESVCVDWKLFIYLLTE